MKYLLIVTSYIGNTLGNPKGLALIKLAAAWAPPLKYVKCYASNFAKKNDPAINTAEIYLDVMADNSKFGIVKQVQVIPNEIFNLDTSDYFDNEKIASIIAQPGIPSIEDYLLSNLADEQIRFDIKVKAYKAYTTLEKELDKMNDDEAIILCCSSLLADSLLIIAARDIYINDSDNSLDRDELATMPSSDLCAHIICHDNQSAKNIRTVFETLNFLDNLIKQSKK